jgi:hypothetical protein
MPAHHFFCNHYPEQTDSARKRGRTIIRTVTVSPDSKYPFKVLETKSKNGTDIQARIEGKQENNATLYIITVENLKKDPGRYYDVITLKTNSPIKPELQLSVYGQILQAARKTQ